MNLVSALRVFGRRTQLDQIIRGFFTFALMLAVVAASAEAAPKFAALTVDVRSGKVLYASDADGIRHPASLTKMMTLYVLFQDLKSGKIKLNSPIRISARAASMAPSKLGAKPGTSITVETAIRALVVKSANDVAAAVAENLGGTEAAFAKRMTRTARSIGMSRSTFVNASGLPNPAQVTTARDMATLGLRLMRDFPQYYPYFRTMSFTYGGRTIRTHNRLLGKFEGTDGIKTGYINASGFNLVSSVRRGDKRIVGVVLGGKSGRSRDAYMKTMLAKAFPSAVKGKAVAALAGSAKGLINPVEPVNTVAKAPEAAEAPKVVKSAELERPDATADQESAGDRDEDGADESDAASGTTIKTVETPDAPAAPKVLEASVGQPQLPAKLPFAVKKEAAQPAVDAAAEATTVASLLEEDWTIQIGAFSTKKDAQARMQQLRGKVADLLAGKSAFTVQVQKGNKTAYRGRFSGFSEESANAACQKILKQKSECQVLAPAS